MSNVQVSACSLLGPEKSVEKFSIFLTGGVSSPSPPHTIWIGTSNVAELLVSTSDSRRIGDWADGRREGRGRSRDLKLISINFYTRKFICCVLIPDFRVYLSWESFQSAMSLVCCVGRKRKRNSRPLEYACCMAPLLDAGKRLTPWTRYRSCPPLPALPNQPNRPTVPAFTLSFFLTFKPTHIG